MPILDQLSAKLDRLAAFEAGPFPVVSLYLNTQPDQNGRDHFEPFLRKELGGTDADLSCHRARTREPRQGRRQDSGVCRRRRSVGQWHRGLRVRRRRPVRSGRARGAGRRASVVHLGPAASLSARAVCRRVSALRGGGRRHQLCPHFRLRRERRRAEANRSKARRRGGTRWAAGRRRGISATSRIFTSSTPRKSPKHWRASSGTSGSHRSSSPATR